MRLTIGTRTRIVAELTFSFDPTGSTVTLELDDDGTLHPAAWVGDAEPVGDEWYRTAQSVPFFVGGPDDGSSAIPLAAGRHFTTARVTDSGGNVHESPSTIIDVVAELRVVTVDELRDKLRNAGGAGARTAGELPDDRLAANLEEAVGEVLGRLSGFVVPVTAAPPLVRTIVLGIAAYLATLEFYGSQPLEDRDPTVLNYARVLSLLGQVASGALVVDGLEPRETANSSGTAAIFQPGPTLGVADGFLEQMYDGRHNAQPYTGGAIWE